MFNISIINLCTEVEGPYKRLAIWFQGCKKRCNDCCNKELQELVPRHFISLDDLYKIIIDSKEKNSIEGVTFLGGEPTLQEELPLLCKKLSENDIGIILFTGYRINEINKDYINYCDVIVDGEFIKEKIDLNRNMVGSTNQNIYYITNRYKNLGWFENKRELNIEINYSDDLYFNGDVFRN